MLEIGVIEKAFAEAESTFHIEIEKITNAAPQNLHAF